MTETRWSAVFDSQCSGNVVIFVQSLFGRMSDGSVSYRTEIRQDSCIFAWYILCSAVHCVLLFKIFIYDIWL